jgi:hypothetical protein
MSAAYRLRRFTVDSLSFNSIETMKRHLFDVDRKTDPVLEE